MKGIAKILKNIFMNGLEKYSLFYSAYRGFVIENQDPEYLNRLQLKVPHVYGNHVMTYWALPKNNFSGKGYGSQCIPRIGDLVWVEFEFGNPRRPIWTHGYFGSKERPDNADLKSYENYWFLTPEGNLVEFDDKNKLIRITNSKGIIIELNDGISLGSKNSSAEPAVLGNTLQQQLDTEKQRVKAIIDAIAAAPTVPQDGGAAFKASIVATLQSVTGPDYSNIKSTKVTLD